MKIFLTVRGNLLLINLVVISLILWLAISFLHLAIAQRLEAVQLQSSINNERVISLASDAVATERHQFGSILKSGQRKTTQQRELLAVAVADTTEKLDIMTAQVVSLISQPGFIEKIPATSSILQEQLELLEQHRVQLASQRRDALVDQNQPANARDRVVLERLFDGQTRIQEDLVSIASSLKFLPDMDAASIAIYHTLLNQILITKVDLARKNSALSHIISGSVSGMTPVQLALVSEKIDQRLPDMVRLALASDRMEQLHPIAADVQDFYRQDYRQVERAIDIIAQPSEQIAQIQSDWQSVTKELAGLINKLADETHVSIEILAKRSASRATRNLFIDIALVVLCFLITLASITINRRVKRYAYQDSLTQLANRMNFESTLVETKLSGSQSHAVIFIDLDRFKSINDTYGHAIGDELLIEVAARLKSICKASDLLARLGGDEFAVLLLDVESGAAVELLASRIVEAIERVVTINNLNLKVGASAGISIAPQDCAAGVQLLRNADIAMYHTKSNNLSSVFRFNQEMALSYQQRLILEQDLKKSLENRQFHLLYQPKICTLTGQVKSVEALLRWSHPERGLVSPDQFIPVAEDMGLMGSIGFWVLNEACREIAQLQKSVLPNLQVAVNISAQQFGDEHFMELVNSALEANALGCESLSLEVTESIVMNDIERVIHLLKTLQESGINIAVDDFGTGYSSLQYLQELPLNTLKIDKAFIAALDDNDPVSSVANSIVQLAALFNLETVAEGVETLEQEMKVRSLGVNHIQGYLYSKPVTAAELPAVVTMISEQFRANHQLVQHRAA